MFPSSGAHVWLGIFIPGCLACVRHLSLLLINRQPISFMPQTGGIHEPAEAAAQGGRYVANDARLHLYEKDIGDDEVEQISQELAWAQTVVTQIELWSNRIGDRGATALANAIVPIKSLTRLALWSNSIGDAGVAALAQSVLQNDTLTDLSLGDNKFGLVGLTALAQALKLNKGLGELWLDQNSIDNDGAVILAEILQCNTVLKILGLSENKIRDAGATALAEALKINATLAKLFLDKNDIADEGATSILEALTVNTTLMTLELLEPEDEVNDAISWSILFPIEAMVNANKEGIRLIRAKSELDASGGILNAHRAELVAKELTENATIKTLLLNKNYICNRGADHLASALVKNRTLTTIGLNENQIYDDGCKAIAGALLQNNVLTHLFLNGNKIGPAGAIFLAQTLQRNDSLQQLGLGRNKLGDDGTVAITVALQSNTSLRRLEMDGNNITDIGALAVLKLLREYNGTMKSLNLEDNRAISSGVQQALDFVWASRLALESALQCLHHEPLEKRFTHLAVYAVQQYSVYHSRLAACRPAAAGPIFHLVRAAAWRYSKVIQEMTPGRKRLRAP
jgi:NLR family CARD domain-containing protein 3